MTQKTNPWTMDVRVRERNLKAGSLTDKDVEKYLSGLTDLADQTESFAVGQPTLTQVQPAPAPVHERVEASVEPSEPELDSEPDLDGESSGDLNGEGEP